jgi:predicted acetyltransferase
VHELIEATVDDKSVLRRLLELYLHDFSEFSGQDLNDHGEYGYRYLDHYWTEPGRHAFLIRVDGRLAGFALVRQAGGAMEMAEFFIVRKYRRQGFGTRTAQRLFDRFPGAWRVRHDPANVAARAFWRRAVQRCAAERFTETSEGHRIVQQFVPYSAGQEMSR